MALIVQKYGGTSVGNTDRIKSVARRVADYRSRGERVVVVVSAMSGVTDGLIKLAKDIAPLPSEREMDMLLATGEQQTIALTAIALHTLDVPAVSMTGAQAGIVTDGVHTANNALLGNYLASTFVASSDGHGGTFITHPPAAARARAQLLRVA